MIIILEYNASFERFDKIYTFLNSLYKSQCTKMLSDISPSLFRQKLLLYMVGLIPLTFPLFYILLCVPEFCIAEEKFSRKICNTRFIFYSNLHIFNTQFNYSTSDINDTSL